MSSYHLKCREKSESKNPEVWKKKNPPKKQKKNAFMKMFSV